MTVKGPDMSTATLQTGLVASVARAPGSPALCVRDVTRSYGELDDTARRWARSITDALGRPAARVGVFGSRSEVSYTGVIAALYSGAAFVPLNPRFPPDRTMRMARLADLDAIIVDKLASAQLDAVLDGLDPRPLILQPEGDDADRLRAAPRLENLPPIGMEDVAYLLFTSGSTGMPKGVPITHGNVRAYLDWASARYGFRPDDRFSQTFDQTFDLSVHDQFLCWENGACLYAMSPPDLLAPARFINRNELTVWFSVPSVVAQMRKRNTLKPGQMPTLRWSLFCGEPLPRASAEAWLGAAPNSIVENLYGPTELTIACCVHRWDPEHSPQFCVNDMVSIGAPFPGLTAAVLDEELKPAPPAEPGELCIAGAQTSPGYWRDAQKTAERFVDLPAGRFYRTGDRVIQLANGEYACLGRVDHQIKVLGFRVELGEIEAVLQKDQRVVQAVALGWPVIDGSAQSIVAFVSGAGLDSQALLATCRAALGDYMVPSAIHIVDEMPLNANGKVDRGALQKRLEQGTVS
jgi:amino acid adenylation domain-containing protein